MKGSFWQRIALGVMGWACCIMISAYAAETRLPSFDKTDWLMIGAFTAPSSPDTWSVWKGFHTDYLAEMGGEAQAQPQERQMIQGKTWRRIRALDMPVNLANVFGQLTNCVVYAYAEFEASASQQVALKMGSDDGVKVWLNGELVLSHNAKRAMLPDDEAVIVTLQAGVNRMLVKITQYTGSWSFAASFRTLEAEQAAWQKITTPRFVVRPSDRLVLNPDAFACTVMTTPAYGVHLPVKIELRDLQGNVLQQATGHTSTSVSLPVPSDFSGVAVLHVTGQEQLSNVTTEETILFGNPETIGQPLIQQARALAQQVSALPEADDLQATLLLYADILEGKGHPTLTAVSYQIAALETLATLCTLITNQQWSLDAFRGLHQWAYRSTIDDGLQPYSLYVPDNYETNKTYALLVGLHGYSGDNLNMMKTLGMAKLRPDDFIVVTPFGRGDMGYMSISEQDVLDVIDKMQARFKIDPDRVYLMGISMGGLGTWRIGQHFAEKFAAIAPFCGWTGTEYLDNLRNVATLVVHGDADPGIPVSMSRDAVKYLQDLQYDVRYDELPGVDHSAWQGWIREESRETKLLEYFRTKRRNPWPTEVVVKTDYLRYGKQYWVRLIDLADPPRSGKITATVRDGSHLTVTTERVRLFALNLAHPQLTPNAPLTAEIDGSPIQVTPQAGEVYFQRQEQGWIVTQDVPSANVIAHHGGGFADVFVRPLIVVYGTQQRAASLKQAAEFLGDWRPTEQIEIGSKSGKFRVKADIELTDEEFQTYHLLLVGNPDENLITRKVADQLPVTFSEGKMSLGGQEFPATGIMLTSPNPLTPSHLVGLMTLPVSDAEIKAVLPYMGLQYFWYRVDRSASDPRFFPDVVVFKSLNFNKVAPLWMGWFDSAWQNLRGVSPE